MERTLKEIRKRARYIRSKTPDILASCFELQNYICDLCGQRIQDLVIAELDHSVPVYYFAVGRLSLEEAERQCNSRNNLRAVHDLCNVRKNTKTRTEWFAKSMDEVVGTAKILTEEEILFLKNRRIEVARKAGSAANKSPENRNRLKRLATFGSRSKGGKIGSYMNKESGQAFRQGKVQGQVNKENGHWDKIRVLGNKLDAEWGRKQGLKNVVSGHLRCLDQGKKNALKPDYFKNLGRMSGHSRHVAKGIQKPECSLCQNNGTQKA